MLQRLALEAVARSRRAGVLRSELAHRLGIEPKDFHYIARVRACMAHAHLSNHRKAPQSACARPIMEGTSVCAGTITLGW